MSHEDLIEKVRNRIAMARKLALTTHDAETAAALRAMADEAERDLRELEAEQIRLTIKPE